VKQLIPNNKAHVRHEETRYDELLVRGVDRSNAREIVSVKVNQILEKWRGSS
jgi:hypothetical protein